MRFQGGYDVVSPARFRLIAYKSLRLFGVAYFFILVVSAVSQLAFKMPIWAVLVFTLLMGINTVAGQAPSSPALGSATPEPPLCPSFKTTVRYATSPALHAVVSEILFMPLVEIWSRWHRDPTKHARTGAMIAALEAISAVSLSIFAYYPPGHTTCPEIVACRLHVLGLLALVVAYVSHSHYTRYTAIYNSICQDSTKKYCRQCPRWSVSRASRTRRAD